MYSGPIRGGTRGGQAEFTWDSVRTDQHRENYLGHSVQAPTGRWQAGRDVNWYNKGKDKGNDASEAEAKAAEQRRAELSEIKAREEEEMNKRLGIKAGVLGSSSGPGAALLRGSRDLGSAVGSSSSTGANTAPLSSASKWGKTGPSAAAEEKERVDDLTKEERSLAKKLAKEEVRKARHDEKIRVRAIRAERRRAREEEERDATREDARAFDRRRAARSDEEDARGGEKEFEYTSWAPGRKDDTEAVHWLTTNFINRTILAHVKDGRAFLGTLICLDPQRNLILTDAEELRLASSSDASEHFDHAPKLREAPQTRWVGMVMVPGKKMTRLEVATGSPASSHGQHANETLSAGYGRQPASTQPFSTFTWPSDEDAYM